MSAIILTFLLIFASLNRFFLINKVPPLLNSPDLTGRIISGGASVLSCLLLFSIIKKHAKSSKVALLTSWVFILLPWTYEQGRIISQPGVTLFLVLLVLFFMQKLNIKFKKLLYLLVPVIIFVSFPQFWLFRIHEFTLTLHSFIVNLFILASFDFLFFKNITFWWGGIREFGVMFLSFLPFFVLGIYRLIIRKETKLLILFLLLAVLAALSPFFPESREFFFITPLLSFAIAEGLYYWSLQRHVVLKTILICLFVFMTYEFFQFSHFYFIHYPQQITGNFSQIHEPF